MQIVNVDCAVIGGGPAGLAAAIEANNAGLKTLILERDSSLGGILQQCIHDGFGLVRFKKRMTGGQYAQWFIDEVENNDIQVMLNSMVLDMTLDKKIIAANGKKGLIQIEAKSIILTMGCRERTRSQVMIYGTRPAGVLTAGTVQRFINMEGYVPGKKAVILGSGDIGLIMARRMTLEKIEVEGVYEIMHSESGLTRNIVQCLDHYDIPLHLATTVKEIHGKNKVEGVTVVEVDENLRHISGTERYIECDLVVLSVGLIPENELSEKLNIAIDPMTKGPVVNDEMMTSIPGFFAAGNVVTVFDLVDYVSLSGEIAARGAARYINEGETAYEKLDLVSGDNINFIVPQNIRKDTQNDKINLFMRVKQAEDRISVMMDKNIRIKNHQVVKPPEMICEVIKKEDISGDSVEIRLIKR
jgi:thioredoxin reductase